MKKDERPMREIAKQLEREGLRCNCDLDNWEPTRETGHSSVCRIHNKAFDLKHGLQRKP